MILEPDRYAEVAPYDLLAAASRGEIGVDRRLIDSILDRIEEAIPELVRFGLEDHENDPVPLDADLVALFSYHPDPRALPFLIELVRRSPDSVEDELLEVICRQGAAAVEPLLALYRELGSEQGDETAFVLAALGVRDPRILELLLERLREDPGEAAFCLGIYGDPAAIPALKSALDQLRAEGDEARWDATAVREAIERLEDPEPRAGFTPFDIRANYPEREPPRFDLFSDRKLLEYLNSRDRDYRAGAAAAFRSRELTAAMKERLFEAAKSDPEPVVRANCWEALGRASDEPEIRGAMLKRLDDTEAPLEERSGALVGLADHAGDPAVRRWILDLYQRPESRAKALEAMWRSLDRGFAGHFTRHLDDPDPAVRREAIAGVGYLGIGSEAGKLAKFFDDENFRADALYAYALAAPGEVSRIRMRQLLNRIDELAGGLTEPETVLVQTAIDDRLAMHGLQPVFAAGEEESSGAWEKPGRNDPCPCGSGKKYKKCCGK